MVAVALDPLAVSPKEAARLLALSHRTVSRLIRAKKLVARKHGKRTLVDYESCKAFHASLPPITGPRLLFGERAHVRPRSRPRRKVRH
jgi:excisionase family DNA binding protein